jgi:hypothetical protein
VDVKDPGYEGVNRIQKAQDRVQWRFVWNIMMNMRVAYKGGSFLSSFSVRPSLHAVNYGTEYSTKVYFKLFHIMNACSYTSIPQHVFMAWCLIKHWNKFTLPLSLFCKFVFICSIKYRRTNIIAIKSQHFLNNSYLQLAQKFTVN